MLVHCCDGVCMVVIIRNAGWCGTFVWPIYKTFILNHTSFLLYYKKNYQWCFFLVYSVFSIFSSFRVEECIYYWCGSSIYYYIIMHHYALLYNNNTNKQIFFFLVFVFYCCVLCYYYIVICNILPERSGIHRRWFIYDAQTFGRLHLQIGSPLPFKVVRSGLWIIALDFLVRSSARRQSIVAPVDKNASTSVDSVSEAIHPQ